MAVAVEDLVKSYGGRRAVDGVSFAVARGETFALLGPNGAGKTTTMEILEGYRAADAGSVRVLGLDPQRDGARLRPRLGVMLQEAGLYRTITPREALRLFASYYAAPADPDALLALVGLDDARARRYRRLSGGQKQRLALALALVGRPGAAVPRRAHGGHGPAGAGEHLGADPPAQGSGRDRAAHDALPGGGRAPRRPRGDHRPRPPGRPRHARRR